MRRELVAGVMAVLLMAGRAAWAGGGEEGPWTSTDFIDFQLPSHWTCNEASPRTCQDSRPVLQQEAMLSFAGKPAKENETLPAYLAYLKRPKTWQEENGTEVTSHVVEAKMITVGGQSWVSVIHEDSELRGFRTRYLATVKDGTVVIVTLTARSDRYGVYESELERGLKSAKLKKLRTH